jgi:hypothetical protein
MKLFENNFEEFKIKFEIESFGITATEAKKLNICIACKQQVAKIRNKQMIKDYNLSALCPRCQYNINS